jgi:hypothetical protein
MPITQNNYSYEVFNEYHSADPETMAKVLGVAGRLHKAFGLSILSNVSLTGTMDIIRTEMRESGKPFLKVVKKLEYKILREQRKKGG